MADTRLQTIGDLCDAGLIQLQTGPFGSQLHAYDYVSQGVAVVPTEAIRNRQINHDVLPQVSFVKAKELNRHKLKVGDILFARRGVQATGHVGYIRERESGFICGTGAILLRVIEGNQTVTSEYLSHVFANTASIEWFKFHAIGATMPNLNEGIIRSFPLALPSLDDQKIISSLLSSIDDKIELNRRMNETLEAMARAIFRDWFVDFGPTRAKAEGRAPYLAPDLWSLFPDGLDDEGKPGGWKAGTLADLSNLNPECWTAESKPTRLEYVDLSNTKWGVIEATETFAWDVAPSRARRVLRCGDTIVGTVRPGNGSYALVGLDDLTGSTGFAVLRPRKQVFREFIYCAATSSDNIDRLAHLADGGAYPAVRPDVVTGTPLLLASSVIFEAFSAVCGPLIDRMEANKRQNHTLAKTRDLLLPKLMSGEIRVSDAERALETAA